MDNIEKSKEDIALEEALSPIVDSLIDKNYEALQDEMAEHIAPLLGPAIREQIENQKDDVVDALYPIMGNMISRYVTKTLEETLININKQIQNGLSTKALKRKVKAKIKGISETELLLQENANSKIEAIFLIHKDTGIVLSQAQNPNHEINEPDMLASMMTAIRSFVNDWVSQGEENHELGEIDYGGNKIILEASSNSYLAVIVEGASYRATYEKISSTLGSIVSKYGDSIREFNGDLDSFPNDEVYKELAMLLINDNPNDEMQTTKIHPLMYIVPLILISWLSFNMYKNYLNDSLKNSVTTTLYKTAQLTSYRLDVNSMDGVVTLSGEVPFKYHKHLAEELVNKIDGVKEVKNNIIVIPTLSDPMQISSQISFLLSGLNVQKGVNLTYTYDYENLTLEGTCWSVELKNKVMKAVKKIKGIKSIKDNISVEVPKLIKKIYFNRGSTTLLTISQTKLIEAIVKLQQMDTNTTIYITSYTDLIGNSKKNNHLSNSRINKVVKFLKEQGKLTNKVITNEKDTPPYGVDPIKEPQKARCVIVSNIEGLNQ